MSQMKSILDISTHPWIKENPLDLMEDSTALA